MREYIYKCFKNDNYGKPKITAKKFYEILKEVFEEVIFDYQDYPLFLPEISAIIKNLAEDKKIQTKDLFKEIIPDESNENYQDLIELNDLLRSRVEGW